MEGMGKVMEETEVVEVEEVVVLLPALPEELAKAHQ